MNGVGKVDKKVLKAGFWVGRGRMVRSRIESGHARVSTLLRSRS